MNFKELACELGLEEDEYLELIELFVQTGMSDLRQLQFAIVEGSPGKVARAAHSLKGAAGNLGLMELSGIAREIEEKVANDRLSEADQASRALQAKLNLIADSIQP